MTDAGVICSHSRLSRIACARLILFAVLLLLAVTRSLASTAFGNFYDLLGVKHDATEAEIKKAYKVLAKKWHPDKNAGDEDAHDRFIELQKAYETLSDPAERKAYDDKLSFAAEGIEGLSEREMEMLQQVGGKLVTHHVLDEIVASSSDELWLIHVYSDNTHLFASWMTQLEGIARLAHLNVDLDYVDQHLLRRLYIYSVPMIILIHQGQLSRYQPQGFDYFDIRSNVMSHITRHIPYNSFVSSLYHFDKLSEFMAFHPDGSAHIRMLLVVPEPQRSLGTYLAGLQYQGSLHVAQTSPWVVQRLVPVRGYPCLIFWDPITRERRVVYSYPRAPQQLLSQIQDNIYPGYHLPEYDQLSFNSLCTGEHKCDTLVLLVLPPQSAHAMQREGVSILARVLSSLSRVCNTLRESDEAFASMRCFWIRLPTARHATAAARRGDHGPEQLRHYFSAANMQQTDGKGGPLEKGSPSIVVVDEHGVDGMVMREYQWELQWHPDKTPPKKLETVSLPEYRFSTWLRKLVRERDGPDTAEGVLLKSTSWPPALAAHFSITGAPDAGESWFGDMTILSSLRWLLSWFDLTQFPFGGALVLMLLMWFMSTVTTADDRTANQPQSNTAATTQGSQQHQPPTTDMKRESSSRVSPITRERRPGDSPTTRCTPPSSEAHATDASSSPKEVGGRTDEAYPHPGSGEGQNGGRSGGSRFDRLMQFQQLVTPLTYHKRHDVLQGRRFHILLVDRHPRGNPRADMFFLEVQQTLLARFRSDSQFEWWFCGSARGDPDVNRLLPDSFPLEAVCLTIPSRRRLFFVARQQDTPSDHGDATHPFINSAGVAVGEWISGSVSHFCDRIGMKLERILGGGFGGLPSIDRLLDETKGGSREGGGGESESPRRPRPLAFEDLMTVLA
ncbi:unnamed protein product [Vitrella brassicaformis CCMP3155]|uniref:J domain-containing protein n=1 Tax=Vitrella brassicaformis (strain CCMP3155) TaxID=1169540 RepID=A0A0G4EE16_VITBC|nr:unnamed protein product [Vitrella brassicaformis CCMP3155]|eukprot:CEL93598.1 unnamed protein product [Vitrella brassicaformis CCMP3155]